MKHSSLGLSPVFFPLLAALATTVACERSHESCDDAGGYDDGGYDDGGYDDGGPGPGPGGNGDGGSPGGDGGGGSAGWGACPSIYGESCVAMDFSGSSSPYAESEFADSCAATHDGDAGKYMPGKCSESGAIGICTMATGTLETTGEQVPIEVVWYGEACNLGIDAAGTCAALGGSFSGPGCSGGGGFPGGDDGADGGADDGADGGMDDGLPPDDTSPTCQQYCNTSADCSAGELCLDTTEGNLCLPSACNNCFSSELTCTYYTNSCEFQMCT